jgi:hypothetical protein
MMEVSALNNEFWDGFIASEPQVRIIAKDAVEEGPAERAAEADQERGPIGAPCPLTGVPTG